MATLSIVPPLIMTVLTVCVIVVGFINHNSHGWLGLPVVTSKNGLYGMLMLLFGRAVAISYPLRLPLAPQKQ